MLQQTIASLLPLLSLLHQPAFCLSEDGTIHSNGAAAGLAPYDQQALAAWLGESAGFYENWDRQSTLELPVTLLGRSYSLSIQAIEDGTLFLLSACAEAGPEPLSVTSQVLRAPLSELMTSSRNLFELLEHQEAAEICHHSASITKNLYRILRLTANLSDLEQVRNGSFCHHPQMFSVQEFLLPTLTEAADALAETGIQLNAQLPDPKVQLYADAQLIRRAILNLISNAAKYCDPGTDITFRTDVHPSAVLFQVCNSCCEDRSQLLSSAFHRMEDRGFLPDPRWGVGLGLQMARYIAQLHGGSIALEARQDGTVTVTMSVSRRRPTSDEQAQSTPTDYLGGLDQCLLELSDVLPLSAFDMDLI